MTRSEQEIMDLVDAGFTRKQIATRTGKSESYITQIKARYSTSALPNPFERMASEGSRKLLAAIAKHHPEAFATADARAFALGFHA